MVAVPRVLRASYSSLEMSYPRLRAAPEPLHGRDEEQRYCDCVSGVIERAYDFFHTHSTDE